MNLKKFLKPDRRKIVVTLIFLFLSFSYVYESLFIEVYEKYRGLPFYFWKYSEVGGVVKGPPKPVTEFLYFNLFIDLVIWYLLSCFLIWIYDKVKKKSYGL